VLLPGLAEDGELYVPDWLFDLSAMTLRGYAPSDEDVLQVCNPIFGTLLFFFPPPAWAWWGSPAESVG
jgi:hypothetical protein